MIRTLAALVLAAGLLAGCDDPPVDPITLWVRDLIPNYLIGAERGAWVRACVRGARDRGVLTQPEGGHENDEQAALLWEAERDAGDWVAAHGLRPFPGRDNLIHVEVPTRLIHKRDLEKFRKERK